jgi:hypothetical protein
VWQLIMMASPAQRNRPWLTSECATGLHRVADTCSYSLICDTAGSYGHSYAQRMSESHFEVEAGIELSLRKLTGITGKIGHCNCNTAGCCLNMSVCAYTTGVDDFTISKSRPTAIF